MAKASENKFPKVQFSEESAPATPSTGEAVIYVKTDGKLYLKDDAGTETDLTSGGGGGGNIPTWIDELDTAPSGTSIDEFDDDSFSGWTTLTITGGQTISEGKDVVSISMTSKPDVTDLNAILQSHSISTGEAVEIAVTSVLQDDVIEMLVAPIITDGTTASDNVAGAMAQFWSGNVDDELYLYPTGTDATLTANGISAATACSYMGGPLYLRIEYDAANTFKAYVSADGVSWTQFGSNISCTMTPTHVGIGFNCGNTGSPTIATVSVDYVRVVTV